MHFEHYERRAAPAVSRVFVHSIAYMDANFKRLYTLIIFNELISHNSVNRPIFFYVPTDNSMARRAELCYNDCVRNRRSFKEENA